MRRGGEEESKAVHCALSGRYIFRESFGCSHCSTLLPFFNVIAPDSPLFPLARNNNHKRIVLLQQYRFSNTLNKSYYVQLTTVVENKNADTGSRSLRGHTFIFIALRMLFQMAFK